MTPVNSSKNLMMNKFTYISYKSKMFGDNLLTQNKIKLDLN